MLEIYATILFMKPQDFYEAIWVRSRTPDVVEYNAKYREKHSEFEQFDMPEEFWYKVYYEYQVINWAVIKQAQDDKITVYFINVNGRAFDKLVFDNENVAKIMLKLNGFVSNNKKHSPYLPVLPIFVSLCKGKKTAPYSKGNLWKTFNRGILSVIVKLMYTVKK